MLNSFGSDFDVDKILKIEENGKKIDAERMQRILAERLTKLLKQTKERFEHEMDLSIQQTQAVMVSMPTWNQLQCNCNLNTIPALPAPFGVKCENINNSKQQLFSPDLTPPSLPSMSDYDSMNSFNSFTQYNVSPPTLGASCNYPLPGSTFSGLCVCVYTAEESI